MNHEQQWYYESNGQQTGPVSWEGLTAGLKLGKLNPNTLVWSSHLSQWRPIHQVMQPRETSPSFDLKPKNSSFPSSVSNLISQIGTKWVVGGALGLLLFGIFSTVVISFVAGPQGVGGIFKSHLLELADSAIKEGLNNPLGYKPLKYHTWKHKKYRATLVLVKFIGTNAFGGQVKAKGWVVVYKDKESKKEKTELVEIHNDSGLPDSFNDSDADVFFGRSSIKVSALPID